MYSVATYGNMITDELRMDAHVEALRRTITKGSVVVDIGTGTGILALIACRLGARRVFAIEPDDIIQIARQTAADNGFGGIIEFFQEQSNKVTLPERADVIISDLRGILPPLQHSLNALIDAHQRLLAPGGTLIPAHDEMWAAVVSAPEFYRPCEQPWRNNRYNLDLSAARPMLTNMWSKARIEAKQLLTPPHRWATLNYRALREADLDATITWDAQNAGVAHGLCVWFDTCLVEGMAPLSNAPGRPELIYGQGFFPWEETVTLDKGDRIRIHLQATLTGEDYIWIWETRVQGTAGETKAEFTQSTFHGTPLSPLQLHKRSSDYLPKLNEEGHLTLFALNAMDGGTSLEEIAQQLADHNPTRFRNWHSALDYLGELSREYT